LLNWSLSNIAVDVGPKNPTFGSCKSAHFGVPQGTLGWDHGDIAGYKRQTQIKLEPLLKAIESRIDSLQSDIMSHYHDLFVHCDNCIKKQIAACSLIDCWYDN